MYGIRKGSPNHELALTFLDEKLGNATATNVVNGSTTALRPGRDERRSQTRPEKAFLCRLIRRAARTNFTPNLTAKQRDEWTAMWTEVKAAP